MYLKHNFLKYTTWCILNQVHNNRFTTTVSTFDVHWSNSGSNTRQMENRDYLFKLIDSCLPFQQISSLYYCGSPSPSPSPSRMIRHTVCFIGRDCTCTTWAGCLSSCLSLLSSNYVATCRDRTSNEQPTIHSFDKMWYRQSLVCSSCLQLQKEMCHKFKIQVEIRENCE